MDVLFQVFRMDSGRRRHLSPGDELASGPQALDTRWVTIVELRDISVQIGATLVLDGIDLSVPAGTRLGVIGPNGAGKTTLLGVVSTLLTPTRGNGVVLGARLGAEQETRRVRPLIAASGHEPALYDDLTLDENLRHVAVLAGLAADDARAALGAVGLGAAADRRASHCSNGMRRRADLARLWMCRPRLVLLDEAHAGLDSDAVAIVDAITDRAVSDGGAAIMVSHDSTLLGGRVDRLVAIRDGRITP